MAKTIPQLTDATTVNAADELIISQGGITKRATGAELAKGLNTINGTVNVKDFGAVGDGIADDYPAFVAAISALPSAGGRIVVPSGAYLLSAEPTWGTKSIYWDIDVAASFSGSGTGAAGKFPNIATNIRNVAAGPWILSRPTSVPSYSQAAVNGATVEMIAPSAAATGYYVSLYAGAAGNSPTVGSDVWALNTLVEANAGAAGAYFGLEVDVVSHSLSAITRGILISGHGSADADVALEIDRNLVIGTGTWFYGITTKAVQNAMHIFVDATLNRGISFSNSSVFPNSLFSGKQLVNNSAAVVIQRNTDTSPTGDLIRCINAANNDILFNVDASGNIGCDGFAATGGDVRTNGGALIVSNAAASVTYFDVRSTGVLAPNLPTSSAGLPSGALWVDTGAGNVVKRV